MRRVLPLVFLAALALAVPAEAMGAELTSHPSRYGRVLFDGSDRVLYLFTKERSKRPRCYGNCADAWPPFKVDRKPKAGSRVKRRLIGTTKRRGRKRQVTYNGHPLYYYVHDDPGEILCHDVFEFGGDWLVVKPRGKPAR